MALEMLPSSANAMPRAAFTRMIPEVHAEGTRSVIALLGEADVSTRRDLCDVLCRVIADGTTGDVVIDLAEVTFIDTAIVRVLVIAQQLLHRQNRILTFRSPPRLAIRVLKVFGMTDPVECEDPVHR
jgi:anti-anti-sigma factor